VAATVNVAVPPLLIVVETGAVVIAGGIRTLMEAAVEFAEPEALVALAQ
jgi:hypothetical protein